jgi:hypothetical protein
LSSKTPPGRGATDSHEASHRHLSRTCGSGPGGGHRGTRRHAHHHRLNVPATAAITNTLDGTDQIATYAPVLSLIDARGTGAGWNLQISATAFSDGAGHTLAQGQVGSVAQACKAGSTCTVATSSGITYPLTIGTVAAKVFNAALNTGLGKLDVTPTINVSIPGNAYAGVYTSVVTIAATTGP